MIRTIVFFLILSFPLHAQNVKYRFLPPSPSLPPPLNNTVSPQLANQNINFNSGNNINGFGINGGFNVNSGGIQGTIQYTQNNTPGLQISYLYQLPTATQFQYNLNQGGFNQGGFNQFNNMSAQPIGVNNPFYQMAMQGITAGVSGSAFQSGGGFGQFLNNNGFNQFNNNNRFNQFGNNGFVQFGGGFNNGGNGL